MPETTINAEKLKAIINRSADIFQQMIENSEHKTPSDYDKGFLAGIKHCLYLIDSMNDKDFCVDVKRPVPVERTQTEQVRPENESPKVVWVLETRRSELEEYMQSPHTGINFNR